MDTAGRFNIGAVRLTMGAVPLDKIASLPEMQARLAYTIPEAVLASGLSRSMLYIAIGRGALRARKCGSRTLILDSDLRRFLRSLPHFSVTNTPSNASRSGQNLRPAGARRAP